MKASFIYMPVFRMRTHEINLIKDFEFGDKICPYIEIVREKDRPRKMSYSVLFRSLLLAIKSPTVFVDIPIHHRVTGNSHPEVIKFLTPMRNVEHRIKSLLALSPSNNMVPVISSYHTMTGETGTVKKQVENLRPTFPRLAFRVSAKDPEFESEMDQVEPWITSADHLIIDFDEAAINPDSEEIAEINQRLSAFSKCPLIILRSAISREIKYKELSNDEKVPKSDNSLMTKYKLLHASAFGDYAGIKKDQLTKGKGSNKITYGCIYYDGTDNSYYGYKGARPGYAALKESVIPSVIHSKASERMRASALQFLSDANRGWKLLHNPSIGRPGDLKRVSMEHYLYCIKTLIASGNLN